MSSPTPSPLPDAGASLRGAVSAGTQTIGGQKTLADGAVIDTRFARVPHAQTITSNGNTVAISGARVHLSGASNFVLAATPSIAAGTVAGQEVQIVNTGSKLITLQGRALASSNLVLRSRTVTLAPNCSLTVRWNGTSWFESDRATHGHRNEHHVADFGAVGDNSTDDTAAIQAAIDAAAADGLPVVLEPGVWYHTTAELLVGATVRFKGAGKFTGGIRCTGVGVRAVLTVSGGTLHVSDLQIYCERAAKVGIYIESASASVVERCHIYQPTVDGLQLNNSDSCRVIDVFAELVGKAFVTSHYVGNLPVNIRSTVTGTVAVTAGSSAVITGTGTSFTSMGIRTGDFIAVHATGAGGPTSTFLPVSTVDSATQITCLNLSGNAYVAGSDYAVFVGNGYHEGPSRADNNNHLIDGWLSRNVAGSGIKTHGLYGPKCSNIECDASGTYPVSVSPQGVPQQGAHFTVCYFELNNAIDNFYLGYVGDILIEKINGQGFPVISGAGRVWGVIRGMQNASDVGRIDPLGSDPVDYVPSAVLVNNVWAKGTIQGLSYNQAAVGSGSLTMKDSNSAAWAAVSGTEPSGGGADPNACGFDFNTQTNVTPGAAKRLARFRNAGTEKAYVDFSGNGVFVGTVTGSNLSGTNTGDVTIGTANGLSLSSQAISLANAVAAGASGAMTGADKTKLDAITGSHTGTNTGDVTIGTANGLSLSGQALSLANVIAAGASGAMTGADKTKLDAISGTNTGDVTIGTANGLSLSGQALSLAAAVAAGASGALTGADKTKLDATSGTNSGDATIATFGSSPTANGATISGQAITLQPADATHPGLLTIAAQTLAGVKTFSSAMTSSVASGSNFASALDGSRLNFSTGDASAYLTRSALNTISTPGTFAANKVDLSGSGSGINALAFANGVGINFSLADNDAYLSRTAADTLRVGGGVNSSFIAGSFVANKAGSADSFTASSATGNALKCLDGAKVNLSTADTNCYIYRAAANVVGIPGTGALGLQNTDSTGSPGATTINKASGRAAIAIGASTVTVTNSVVAAADTVLVTALGRDATCVNLVVDSVSAGSFVVSGTAVATAATKFMFAVIKAI